MTFDQERFVVQIETISKISKGATWIYPLKKIYPLFVIESMSNIGRVLMGVSIHMSLKQPVVLAQEIFSAFGLVDFLC